jgi:G3E family GTPase
VGVGGFLGAGKTTLITMAAARLRAAGRRVAVITNDQASGLVDTAAARAVLDGASVAEIAGGCFCCRFDDLARTLAEVIDRAAPEVILAEAVGSCTDLAATVYQPLRQLDLAPVRLGPLTVVVDALRLQGFRRFRALPLLPADVGYLYGRQLAEADALLLNKTDLLESDQVDRLRAGLAAEHPGAPVLPVSALRGTGLAAWLALLHESDTAGERVLDLDYDRYAAAEACLGWLNLEGSLTLTAGDRAAEWARAVLERTADRARAAGAEVAHVKLRLDAPTGTCAANLVGADRAPSVAQSGTAYDQARLVLNARVAAEPETLRSWIEEAMGHADASTGGTTRVARAQCLAPARPVPTHRLQPL